MLPPYLREFKRDFSVYDGGDFTGVYLLAGGNVLGSWWLWGHAQRADIPVLAACQGLINWLVLYGTFFVTVPALRWTALLYINSRIERETVNAKKTLFTSRTPPLIS